MTTRKMTAPTYVDLAKASARIERKIAPADCVRLAAVAENVASIDCEFNFCWNQDGRIEVAGRAATQLELPCQLCNLPVAIPLKADIAGVLARSEQEAQTWREQDAELNIIVIGSAELNEIELVEDELLLRLPSNVCVDASCESRPALTYGPEVEEVAADTHRPFAALAELRQQMHRSDAQEAPTNEE